MATYQHIRSSTANKRPTTSIADGQLAINTNTASPGLFFKDSAGTGIVKVGPVHVGTTAPNATPAAGGSSGNYLGEQWLDTSVSPAQMKVWNGSAWIGIVADELPVSKLQDGAARQLIQTDAAGTGVEWTSNIDVPGTLDVTSTATFDSIASHPLGSAGAPTITFTGDLNTGIYSPGADQVSVATSGTERLRIDSTGQIEAVSLGTAAAPAFSWTGDPNTGIYSPGADQVGISTNGSERLRVNSGGLLGLATSNPQTLLSLLGGYQIGWNHATDGTKYAEIYADTSSNLIFRNTNSQVERMRLDSSGRLGLGTSSPVGRFDIDGGSSAFTVQFRETSGAYHRMGIQKSNDLLSLGALSNDGSVFTSILNVSANGNRVGVGTTDIPADTNLAVLGNYQTGFYRNVTSGARGYFVNIGAKTSTGFADGGYIFGAVESGDATGYLAFGTRTSGTVTEKFRCDSSGRLLVGTSSAITTTFLGTAATNLQVQSVNNYGSTQFFAQGGTTAGNGYFLELARSRGTTAGSTTAVEDGDTLGAIVFSGANGSTYIPGAQIRAFVDGAVSGGGAADLPTRLVFFTTADGSSSPTERMRIDSSGRVGVGTTPSELLHVNGNALVKDRLLLQRLQASDNLSVLTFSDTLSGSKGNNLSIGNPGGFDLLFHTAGVERARIDSSGRLLVGTSSTSANSTLVLQGQSAGSTEHARLWICKGSVTPASGSVLGEVVFGDSSQNPYAIIGAYADAAGGSGDYPSRLVFSTCADGASSPTEAMRIDSSQNVLIGTTNSASASDSGIVFTKSGASLWKADGTGDLNQLDFYRGTSGSYAQVGKIVTTSTGTSFTSVSDYRLKENVTAVTDGIKRLQQLKPSRFNFITDSAKTVDGFIAHEVQTVVPEAISGEKDAVDDDGNPIYQGIDQSKLVPLLTAALQEAVAKVESLEARLTAAGI